MPFAKPFSFISYMYEFCVAVDEIITLDLPALGGPRSDPDWVFVSIKSFCSRISDKLIFIESLSRDYLGEVNVFFDKSLFERIHKILFFALKNEKQKCLEIWSQ